MDYLCLVCVISQRIHTDTNGPACLCCGYSHKLQQAYNSRVNGRTCNAGGSKKTVLTSVVLSVYWCTTTLGPTDTRFGTWFCRIWWLKIIIPGCSVQPSELPVSTCSKDCSHKIQQSHNARCNRNGHTCAHICYKVVHYGIRDQCIMGFMRMVY